MLIKACSRLNALVAARSSFLILSTVVVRLSRSTAFVPTHTTIRPLSTMSSTPQHIENAPSWFLPERTKVIQEGDSVDGKCIVYWMQRDVRTQDNWALLYANHLAKESKVPLRVLYCLNPPPSTDNDEAFPKYFLETQMTKRYGSFLLGGLELVHGELAAKNVPLDIIMPSSPEQVGSTVNDQYLSKWQPQCVICDHSPLKPYRQWMEEQLPQYFNGRVVLVDAHNVVPVWHAAPVRQIGARTLRTKINKVLTDFLTPFPHQFSGNTVAAKTLGKFEKQAYIEYLKWDDEVEPVEWAQPGNQNAMKQFEVFCDQGLKQYDDLRNDPNYKHICSNMSPWINHGHVSFQQLAKTIKEQYYKKCASGSAGFIEEGLVRRELSDNFVYYEPQNYDSLDAALGWAQETLEVHTQDQREWLFSTEELEGAQSHDMLWNAAQLQLMEDGKLHGFLRMYWAKKILEWTASPQVALSTAQYFNDKYALDGCDPNGFVGVGWSIMGIHDQGWKEREIFGKIRYMNFAGCNRKFDVAGFVEKYPTASKNAFGAAKKYGGEPEIAKKKRKAAPKKAATTKKKAAGTKRKSRS